MTPEMIRLRALQLAIERYAPFSPHVCSDQHVLDTAALYVTFITGSDSGTSIKKNQKAPKG